MRARSGAAESLVQRAAIFDTETTGVYKKDRIVELGVVIIDLYSWEKLDEYQTLINPNRDPGPTRIHGITSSMLAGAPEFGDIVPELARLFDGAILVAHNLQFDIRMLRMEFDRLGIGFDPGIGICTLSRTRQKLGEACASYGIELKDAHQAIDDARATTDLLREIFEEEAKLYGLANFQSSLAEIIPPTDLADHGRIQCTRDEVKADRLAFPTRRRHIIQLSAIDPLAAPYVDLLGMALEDFILSNDEVEELKAEGARLGLSPEMMDDVHIHVLKSLSNHPELLSAGRKLEGTLAELAEQLSISWPFDFEILEIKGRSVCFTGDQFKDGEFVERGLAVEIAEAHGWTVVETVTKSRCSLLVAADSEPQSGKGVKARHYGIPIITWDEFLAKFAS